MPRLSTPRIAATLSVMPLPGMVVPGARTRRHAGAGIGRAAHHLDRLAGAGIDAQHLQLVCLRVLFGGEHLCDAERRKRFGRIVEVFHLEADVGQLVGNRLSGRLGFEMVLQPRQGELHAPTPPESVGTSSARKP